MSDFDPGVHTVAQVREHLAGADETERGRVLAAERAGKGRASIVGHDEPDQAGADQPAEPGGPFDAAATARAALDELIGDQPVLARRRAYATVLHTADVAAARRAVEPSETVRAALRLGEP